MIDHEKLAHELSILYMQAEIANGEVATPDDDTFEGFVSLYFDHYEDILKVIDRDY